MNLSEASGENDSHFSWFARINPNKMGGLLTHYIGKQINANVVH